MEKRIVFLPEPDPKEEPDTRFYFNVIQLLNGMAQKVIKHTQIAVLPRVAGATNIATLCENATRDQLQVVEKKICLGLGRCLTAAIKHIAKLFAKYQKSTDYKPRDDAQLDAKPTKCCQAVIEFMALHFEVVLTSLDGRNLDKFLTVYGKAFHSTVVAHLKKLQVSILGGPLLARDIKEYSTMARMFHVPSVNSLFDQLRILTSVFFVTVDNLRPLLVEPASSGQHATEPGMQVGALSNMDMREVHTWIMMRADYQQNKAKIVSQIPVGKHSES